MYCEKKHIGRIRLKREPIFNIYYRIRGAYTLCTTSRSLVATTCKKQ